MRVASLDRLNGFPALAFGVESLFFGACSAFFHEDLTGLSRDLSSCACVGFLIAYLRGDRMVRSLVGWLLLPTSLLVFLGFSEARLELLPIAPEPSIPHRSIHWW